MARFHRPVPQAFLIPLGILIVFLSYYDTANAASPKAVPQRVISTRVAHLTLDGEDQVIRAALWGGDLRVSCYTVGRGFGYGAQILAVSDGQTPVQGWSPNYGYYEDSLAWMQVEIPWEATTPGFATQVLRAVRGTRTLRVEASSSVSPGGPCDVSYTVEESDNTP